MCVHVCLRKRGGGGRGGPGISSQSKCKRVKRYLFCEGSNLAVRYC